jgi:thiamine-monophosphate kinase
MTSEFAIIDRIRRMLPGPPAGQTWIGDDAAVVPSPAGRLLLSCDAVVAGVHGDMALMGPDDLGWKAVTTAVSDIAAMGGTPAQILVTVAAPPDTDLDSLYRGIRDAAAACECAVVGGDLVNAPVLVVSVAVAGSVDGEPVLRSGARPGDAVLVTRPVGASALGLRLLRSGRPGPVAAVHAHRRPMAEVAAGRAARAAGATAMIDISDGLAADLGHLAEASGVGLALDAVPVAEGATLEDALHGGEDYALAFTAPDPDGAQAAFAAAGLPSPAVIGRCTADLGDRTLSGHALPPGGFEHRWER